MKKPVAQIVRFLLLLVTVCLLVACQDAGAQIQNQKTQPTRHASGTGSGSNTTTMPSDPPSFFTGFSRPSWGQGEYGTPEEQQSFNDMLSEVNATCVAVVATQYLAYVGSTQITAAAYTATDTDLENEFHQIQEAGKCIFLAIHVDYLNDNAHWGTDIGDNFSEANWQALQKSYTDMMMHYAQVCQQAGCALLSIGNEFTQFSKRSDYWRGLIQQIRTVFSGKLTYSAWWDTEKNEITWWDALDYIGVNPWLPLANTGEVDPSLDEIRAHWDAYLPTLTSLATTYNKQLVFTEIGYPSYQGMSTHPYLASTATSVPDQNEQANAYQVLFEKVIGQSWIAGIFLWYWPLQYSQEQYPATDVSVKGKSAEQIIANTFANLN